MRNDAVLRRWLVCLAAAIAVTGVFTHSWKKMVVTYCFGMLAVAGLLLPDWKFFDRPVSHWSTLVSDADQPPPPSLRRRWLKVILYGGAYIYGIHKWWNFITS